MWLGGPQSHVVVLPSHSCVEGGLLASPCIGTASAISQFKGMLSNESPGPSYRIGDCWLSKQRPVARVAIHRAQSDMIICVR